MTDRLIETLSNRERCVQDSEYKRRVREQESMRERVLLAKEARRRKNAVLHTKLLHDRCVPADPRGFLPNLLITVGLFLFF